MLRESSPTHRRLLYFNCSTDNRLIIGSAEDSVAIPMEIQLVYFFLSTEYNHLRLLFTMTYKLPRRMTVWNQAQNSYQLTRQIGMYIERSIDISNEGSLGLQNSKFFRQCEYLVLLFHCILLSLITHAFISQNIYHHVCGWIMFLVMSFCLSLCLSMFLSVQAITFEPLNIETSYFVCRYILSLSTKVFGSRWNEKNDNFTYFNLLILCMWLQVINKVKITYQGNSHNKVKEKYLCPFQFCVTHTISKRVVCILPKCSFSVLYVITELYRNH